MEIEIKNLKYKIGNNCIIDSLNLKLSENKIYTILGSSGSGKTILANLMYGSLVPSNGEIVIDHNTINNNYDDTVISNIRKIIGKINQDMSEHLFFKTVEEEFLSTLEKTNYSIEKKVKKINDSLKIVNLEPEILKREPITLSSGEISKISLANALLFNPKILLLDEPINGLDSYEQKNLIKILKMIKRKYNKMVIIFSKNVEFANLVSDEILILNEKNIVHKGSKKEIFDDLKLLSKSNIDIPKIIELKLLAEKHGIKLNYRDDRNDIIKDILRNI